MTNDYKIEIEKIQKELKQLSQKHLELSRAHQQRVKSHEEQKTLYQHLLGQQPPLQPDPELQSVISKIEDLKEQKNLVRAMASRGYIIGKAVAVAGLLVTGFTAFVQLKNKNRFNK